MPTYDAEPRFLRDYARLTSRQSVLFAAAFKKMVADLKAGSGFRKGLRIKGVQGQSGIFEMTWAPDGRATFSYGTSPRVGDVHIIWRRIGGHEIFQYP
ncbi:MAG TPA: hypothetical protein VGR57_13950 [Ktedonobacterales bacterium]|nr:hypothetical protein [Ktedonobacterales bacterium]